jgi:hypothetical protein
MNEQFFRFQWTIAQLLKCKLSLMVWNILKDPWSLDPGNWEYFTTSSQIDTEGIWEYCSNQGYQEYSKKPGLRDSRLWEYSQGWVQQRS